MTATPASHPFEIREHDAGAGARTPRDLSTSVVFATAYAALITLLALA
jgi:hypothetical protein